MPTVKEVVDQVAETLATERDRAIALHDYVRENVKFGFTKYHDAAQPDYTLAHGLGHCNPKSLLMVALFRAAGLESHQHFVVIPKVILKGVIAPFGYWTCSAELSHSYCEVKIEGTWYAIDSYIIDTPLFKAARAKLEQEGRSFGYGVRANATNVWDGQSNAFSQFDQSMMIEDHGRIEDLEAYLRSRKYRNRVLGLRATTGHKLVGDAGLASGNSYIDGIRGSFIE